MTDLVRLGVAVYLLSAGIGWVDDFVLMRWVVFVGVGFLLIVLLTREIIGSRFKLLFAVLFSGIIYLFNPIFPVYLYDIGLWRIIDFTAAAILIVKPILINTVTGDYIKNQKFMMGLMNEQELNDYLREKSK